jgi:tripartite-type tricarboxylate transporter receptor subunit TctC
VPALASAHEQGLANFDASTWLGFFLPKGTPAPIVQKLHDATVAAMNMPAVQQRLKDTGNGCGRARTALAGLPAKIGRERDREMGGSNQGRGRDRGVTRK